MLSRLKNWILPYTCILCGNPSSRAQDLCSDCLKDFPHLTYACPGCAKPFIHSKHNLHCGMCLKNPSPYSATFALFLYEPPITKLIMDLKFGQALVNATILGELLAEKIQHQWYVNKALPEVIIPMPMHPHRLRERGFNQALEIARPVMKKLHLPMELTRCQRSKHTAAQATLPAKERKQNIKNAFSIAKDFPYQSVAVIDDVITTGHTMTEFCLALQRAGVQRIDVWCIARPLL